MNKLKVISITKVMKTLNLVIYSKILFCLMFLFNNLVGLILSGIGRVTVATSNM